MIVAKSHLPLKLDAISTTMIIIVVLNKTLAIKGKETATVTMTA